MNFFELYRAAVLRYLEQSDFSSSQVYAIRAAFGPLRRSYFETDKIDYSSEWTRLAYSLSLAPRHAVIWREYLRAQPWGNSGLTCNSLGTGSGAEIVGVMEGTAAAPSGKWQWHCHDVEPGWQSILKAVVEEYQRRTGTQVGMRWVGCLGELERSKPVVGSFVLSELVKQGSHRGFRASLARAVGPTEGLFLDVTRVNSPSGPAFLSGSYGFGYANLGKSGIRVKDTVNSEMAAAGNIPCMARLLSEPSLNMFFPRFR